MRGQLGITHQQTMSVECLGDTSCTVAILLATSRLFRRWFLVESQSRTRLLGRLKKSVPSQEPNRLRLEIVSQHVACQLFRRAEVAYWSTLVLLRSRA